MVDYLFFVVLGVILSGVCNCGKLYLWKKVVWKFRKKNVFFVLMLGKVCCFGCIVVILVLRSFLLILNFIGFILRLKCWIVICVGWCIFLCCSIFRLLICRCWLCFFVSLWMSRKSISVVWCWSLLCCWFCSSLLLMFDRMKMLRLLVCCWSGKYSSWFECIIICCFLVWFWWKNCIVMWIIWDVFIGGYFILC